MTLDLGAYPPTSTSGTQMHVQNVTSQLGGTHALAPDQLGALGSSSGLIGGKLVFIGR